MSGGVDSALAAVLFRDAGWNVIGVTMPIYQDPEDTERGKEACKELGIEHKHMDLTHQYEFFFSSQSGLEFGLVDPDLRDDKSVKIRLGNIRARLRMITLYNLAAANNGLVISTDNYSELAMGFWTLHGDVGDVSPIQSLGKSWEVPMLAKLWKVPESIWKAKPTDGLGVDDGDEAQFGFTYLELDIMLFSIAKLVGDGLASDNLENAGGINKKNIAKALSIEFDPHAVDVFELVMQRIGSTWFKRMNPINIVHPLDGRRYVELDHLDEALFHPDVVGG